MATITQQAPEPMAAIQDANTRWRYFVLPKDSELPTITKPAADAEKPPADPQRTQVLDFWKSLMELHKHEDTLFNSRLQGFLFATSFLVAAFSQFKDTSPAHQHFRWALCCFGLCLALVMAHILRRTARAIEWYLATLIRLDSVLYGEQCQPFRSRRQLQKTLTKENRVRKPPVLFWLGIFIPWVVVFLWVFLLGYSYKELNQPVVNPLTAVATPTPAALSTPAPVASATPAKNQHVQAQPTPGPSRNRHRK